MNKSNLFIFVLNTEALYFWFQEILQYGSLLLCAFFVTFLIVLGVQRFYQSTSHRIRQYQLDYLKKFNMLDNELYTRLLKLKTKTQASVFYIGGEMSNRKTMNDEISATGDNSSQHTNDSSVTILSLKSSSLEDYKSIMIGRPVKSKTMYDLASIIRQESAHLEAQAIRNEKRRVCKRKGCKKHHHHGTERHHRKHRRHDHHHHRHRQETKRSEDMVYGDMESGLDKQTRRFNDENNYDEI